MNTLCTNDSDVYASEHRLSQPKSVSLGMTFVLISEFGHNLGSRPVVVNRLQMLLENRLVGLKNGSCCHRQHHLTAVAAVSRRRGNRRYFLTELAMNPCGWRRGARKMVGT